MVPSLTQFSIAEWITLFIVALFSFAGCNYYGDEHPPIENSVIQVNGTQLYCETAGRGSSILVVHGGPMLSHNYLQEYLLPLANDYRVLFYDQRLSGRSSADVDSADISLDQFVDDIEALRRAYKLRDIHLIGHSWGGLLAMKYAKAYPDSLKSLVLLSPMPPSRDLWTQEEAQLRKMVTPDDSARKAEISQKEAFKNREPEVVADYLRASFAGQFHDQSQVEKLDFYVPEDYQKRSQKFSYLMPELQDYNVIPSLDSVDVPSLLIYGADEPSARISGDTLRAVLENSRFKTIPESGHFTFVEAQDQTLQEISTFLEEVD